MVTTRSTWPPDTLEATVQRLIDQPPEPLIPVSERHAAVLIALFEDAQRIVRVLLTKRASNLNSHRGEVALPGGKRDPGDRDNVDTALREAQEEVGLDPQLVQVLGTLPPLLSIHRLSVTPVVGVVPAACIPTLRAAEAEVAAIFDVPLALFLGAAGHSQRDVAWLHGPAPGVRFRLHYFECGELGPVWGLTAAILIEAARRAFAREPEFAEHAGRPFRDLWWDGEQVAYRQRQPALS
ncbi:hypothetical protein WJX81_001045 [Elliptochloris bilobata]|uniref:Nudix hydrolase domain-containing protein n=1 Tax=Elliptochloris bilobata TaxID=381761 RepID=A0AAW1SIE0_9CHLO